MGDLKSSDEIKKAGFLSILKRIPPIGISVLVMIGFLVVFYSIDNSLLKPLNVKILIFIAAGLLCVGLGQNFPVLTGGIDLSVGGIISLVSVISIMLLPALGYWSYIVTLGIAAACGFLNGSLAVTCRIPSFLLTLGTGGIFTSVTYLLHAAPMSFPSDSMHYAEIFNGNIGPFKIAWLWALLLFFIFWIVQKYTYIGRTVYAVGVNERMAWMSGINVKKTRIFAFTMSGIGAGTAGLILSNRLYSGSAIFGAPYILESIATVVVGGIALTGGTGTALNVLIGAIIMGILKNGLTIAGVDVMAQQSFLGVLIILAVAITFDRSKLTIVK